MGKKIPNNFIATVYQQLEPLKNSSLSKSRVKIFYKGLNRNGSYIDDNVAEQLIASLPGTPIVGYFDADKDDFLGHVEREKNVAYGFVPQEMNFKWEMSLDPDGVYRTYACTDIVLWTGRYPIASKIVGKNHSMEINDKTYEGEWVEEENDFYFKFTKAEFIGLCVLGEEYEPCFEGSHFYSLDNFSYYTKIKKDLVEMFNIYNSIKDDTKNQEEGGTEVDEEELKKNEALVDSEGQEKEEEKQEEVEQKEPVAQEDQQEEKEEQKEEEQEEKNETDNSAEENKEEIVEEEALKEVEEKYNKIIADKDKKIEELEKELLVLKEYQKEKIEEEKDEVIESYSNKLSQENLEKFKNNKSSYSSAIELKKEIALCLLEQNENKNESSDFSLVNTQFSNLSSVEAIVADYVKNKNN